MTQVSYGTITITDTNDIESIYMVYRGAESDTTPPTLDWNSISNNQWKTDVTQITGTYIWQVTVITKSGVTIDSSNWTQFYGDPICITGPQGIQGPQGGTGPTGKGVKSVVTYYYLSTSSSSVTGGSWSTTPQDYPSTGTKYYWTKTITTYTDDTTYESTAVYNKALTNSVKDARDANSTAQTANTTAQNANNKADEAWNKADNAETIAGNASTAISDLNQYFWRKKTASTNVPAGSYVTNISGTDYQANPANGGFNSLVQSTGIFLRNGITILSSWTGDTLTFNKPGTSNVLLQLSSSNGLSMFKGTDSNNTALMNLNGSSLNFYGSSSSTPDATLNSNGLKLVKGGIESGSYSSSSTNFIYLSTNDYNGSPTITINGNSSGWRQIIGSKFGVKNDGTLYATGGRFSGRIEATEGYIANSVTIGSGGTALSTIEANAKQSQIYKIGYNGTVGIHFLGVLTIPSQTAEAEFEIHTGPGQNNRIDQNLTIRVNIKRGWQGASDITDATCAGVTIKYEGDPTIITAAVESKFKIYVTCINRTSGIFNVYMETNEAYADGWYQIKGRDWTWTHNGQTPATITGTQLTTIGSMNPYTTATNYITQISANNGIRVHNVNDSTNYVQINSTCMSFYKSDLEVARFGEWARIGKDSGRHIDLDSNGMRIYSATSSNNNNLIANIGYSSYITDSGSTQSPTFSIGTRNGNIGAYSISMGKDNTASGYAAIAMGIGNSASAHWTTAIGGSCQASGTRSIAIGHNCKSTNNWTTTIGANLISGESNQTVIGRGNESKGGAFIVGGGSTDPSSTNRFNLLELDWGGTLTVKGRVEATRYDLTGSGDYVGYIQGYSGDHSYQNSSYTNIFTLNMAEGDWIITYSIHYPTNSNGVRGGRIRQIDSRGEYPIGTSVVMVRAANNIDTAVGATALIHISSGGGSINLDSYQNSGGSLTGSYYLNVMRVA